MENILELNKQINSFSDEELLINYQQKPPIHGKLNYFPVFAVRIGRFKDLIFKEAISKHNTALKFRGFKTSWFIVISVLDFCQDEAICFDLIKHIKNNWKPNDFNNFAYYIKSKKRIYKYLKNEL